MSPSLSQTSNNRPFLRVGARTDEPNAGVAGIVATIVFHACIIAATIFTFQHARLDITDQSPPIVPVDLVTIGEKTNIAPTVQQPSQIVPQAVQPPSPPLTPPTPQIQQPEEPAPDEAASEPVLPKPMPSPVPRVKPQTETPQPAKKKTADNSLDSLLNNLTSPQSVPKNARVASRTQRGFGQQNAMTMDLVDSLRNQIEQCMDWGVVAGAPNAQNIVVSVDLTLNPDGSVVGTPQLESDSRAAAAHDPYTRAAADAAMRAIQVCKPYKLPPDRYGDWRDSVLNFSPRDVVGQ